MKSTGSSPVSNDANTLVARHDRRDVHSPCHFDEIFGKIAIVIMSFSDAPV
jgi:hypothetical protein